MRLLAVLPLLMSLTTAPGTPAHAEVVEPGASRRTELVQALDVLHTWDASRARAWAGSDPQALHSLYVRGSAAGEADVRLLRAYRARGLVVRRLVTQVFAATVRRSDAWVLTLEVSDRIAGGVLRGHGRATALPSSPPVSRTIELRRGQGGWRVAAVSGSGRDPRAARP